MVVLKFDTLRASYLREGMLDFFDILLITIQSGKMRNAVRRLKCLEDKGIRKCITNKIKVGSRLAGCFVLHHRCVS